MSDDGEDDDKKEKKAPVGVVLFGGHRIPPGVSGNPGGKPKELADLRRAIRARGSEIVDWLFEIAAGEATRDVFTDKGILSETPKFQDRLAAIALLTAYG